MSRRHAQGFLLLEVLVSILIFSIGVLALVGLQGRMSSAQTAAKLRAEAAALANEVIGVMWSDVNNLGSYTSANCAAYDPCSEWQGKVSRQLPGGVGAVLSVNTGTGLVTIQIQWKQGSSDIHAYSTSTNIRASM
ncbi:MAG: hypothetical protein RI907_859 [Pseudomonadota bacterium]|jgi:type IV pilus assembly protein PilV